ncbi:MAG: hypothetical protein Kow0037_18090 [Calditrichia bacterium]
MRFIYSNWLMWGILSIFLMTPLFGQDYIPDQLLVCFLKDVDVPQPTVNEGIVQTGLNSFDQLCQKYQVSSMEKWLTMADEKDIDGEIKLANIYRLKIGNQAQLASAITDFANNEWTHSAEYEYIEKVDVVVEPFTPNDPSLQNQWYIGKTMTDWAWGLWTIFGETPGDSTIVIGVVDSGVQWDHPDLIANIWVNPAEDIDGDGVVGDFGAPSSGGDEDGIDNDGNGKVDDLIGWDMIGVDPNNPVEDNNPMPSASHNHGTMVAGTASGVANNGLGIAGVGYRVKIMPVKCSGEGSNTSIWRSTDGVLYAAKTGADIINCSFGSYNYSAYAQSVYNTAHDTYGAIIFGSAGNDNKDMDLPGNAHYPSNFNNVICVAGTNSDDTKAGGSNYGSAVDISSPYSNIFTTNTNSGYTTTNGTSFSSPIAAGCMALLKSKYPTATQSWLESQLINSTDNIDAQNPNYLGKLGTGRVNPFNAIGQAMFPNVNYVNHTMAIINDDGDGLLNPGEGATLRVTLRNEKDWQNIDQLEATLRCNNPHIQITDSTANYGAVNNGSITVNITDPFEFFVDSLAGNGDYSFTLYLRATSGSNPLYEKYVDLTINVSGYQLGWPVNNLSSVQCSPVVKNLMGSDSLEIFSGTNGGKFYGWKAGGQTISNFPLDLGGQMWGSPALGDVDNDGAEELVMGTSGGHVYILTADGTIEKDMNIGEFVYGTVSLADFDLDGDLELVFGTFSGNIHVKHHDGSDYPNFPYAMGATERVTGGCAIADIDGDGVKDIIAATQGKNIFAVSSGGNLLNGFPYNSDNGFIGSPVVVDLDGSGPEGLSIIAGNLSGKLQVIDAAGNLLWEAATNSQMRSSPGLADIDSDGKPEIFIGNNDQKIYGFHSDGTAVNGFPLSIGGKIESQPVFADLLGTGDIVMIITGIDGILYGYNFNQQDWAVGFPASIAGQIKSTPTIADIDLDNDLEIAFGTNNSFAVIDVKQKGGSTANFWSTFQGNYYRTGYYGDAVVGIKNTTGTLPIKFDLSQNYPNPFNPTTTIRFTIPKNVETRLEVFNVLGEKVATLINQRLKAGEYTVNWDGSKVASGIYFYRLKAGQYSATRRMLLVK